MVTTTMKLTKAQVEALAIAEKKGQVSAGWQPGLGAVPDPKGSTLLALERRGLLKLTRYSSGLVGVLTLDGVAALAKVQS